MGSLTAGASPGAIAVFGATSGIARSAIEHWMSRGRDVLLIGRSGPDLEALARDLEVAAGRRPPILQWDVTDFAGATERFQALLALAPGGVGGLLMAAGVMFPQEECSRSPEKTALTFAVNLSGPALVMDRFAEYLRSRGRGFICCLSSLAGDRGRASNFAYGASKAGLTAYLEGLRGSLRGSGVRVVTVKPGPVRTRMTAGRSGPLLASPGGVGRTVARAAERGREVVYAPGYWRAIMAVLRALPGPVFHRLKL